MEHVEHKDTFMETIKQGLPVSLAALLIVRVLLGNDAPPAHALDAPLPPDTLPIVQPEIRKDNLWGDGANRIISQPFISFFDLSRHIRSISGKRTEAGDTDPFGNVPDCSWYTNRIAHGGLTPGDLIRGPAEGPGPDTSREWIIYKSKSIGGTPGFSIRDARGDSYLIKFDPPRYPELATAAEMISTRLFYAAGYNVPSNYIVEVDPHKLRIADGVMLQPKRGNARTMTHGDLDSILAPLDRMPDGRIRALASRYISGVALGGWTFSGTRHDDPNDFIPHEHRRELRARQVIDGWVNNFDNNIGNGLDVYDTAGGRNHVRHYVLDFSSTFGSSTYGPKPKPDGHASIFSPTQIAASFFTLGLYTPVWEKHDTVPFASVGLWDAVTFQPQRFKPLYPSRAFENMTTEDAFWAARIVMGFSDAHIDSLVRLGQYSDPRAEAYVAQVLKERRDKIGRHYFAKVNPLDRFSLVEPSPGSFDLSCVDPAIRFAFTSPSGRRYAYWFAGQKNRQSVQTQTDSLLISFSEAQVPFSKNGHAVLCIETQRGSKGPRRQLRLDLQKSGLTHIYISGIHR